MLPNWFGSLFRLVILAVMWIACHTADCSAASTNSATSESFNYAEPKLLTGTVYAVGSNQTNILFTFRRSATRSGSTIRVERRFDRPDGSNAAVENIIYESGRLLSYKMKEFQAGLWGTIRIYPDPKNPARKKIIISHGRDTDTQNKGTVDDLPKNTVIDDSLYPFLLAHWDELDRGNTVKFRFVSLEWEKTFGFRLAKTAEFIVNGKSVVEIKMEPTSLIVSRFMNPIYFSIEKEAPHRMLEYIGRTTPRFKKGKSWKYLDAETVFDWK